MMKTRSMRRAREGSRASACATLVSGPCAMSVNLPRGAVRIRAARPSVGTSGQPVRRRARPRCEPPDRRSCGSPPAAGCRRRTPGRRAAHAAQQAARVTQAPARIAGARQRDGDRVKVDEAVPAGLRQVGKGGSVVEAHVRVDDDSRVGVRGPRQGGAAYDRRRFVSIANLVPSNRARRHRTHTTPRHCVGIGSGVSANPPHDASS